jgi:hypothetical protein
VLHEAPLVQDDETLRQLQRLSKVVGDEHDGACLHLLQMQKLPLDFVACNGVEGSEGLIEEKDPWIQDHSATESHPLLLPPAQLVRVALGEGKRQIHQPHKLLGPGLDLLYVPFGQACEECDVFLNREMGEKPSPLDRIPDPQSKFGQAPIVDGLPENGHRAAARPDQPVDHLQQRRFPAAARADHRGGHVVREGEIDILKGLLVAVDLADLFERDLCHPVTGSANVV